MVFFVCSMSMLQPISIRRWTYSYKKINHSISLSVYRFEQLWTNLDLSGPIAIIMKCGKFSILMITFHFSLTYIFLVIHIITRNSTTLRKSKRNISIFPQKKHCLKKKKFIYQLKLSCVSNFFKKSGFTSCKAEQSLNGKKLQERKVQKH